MEKKQSGDDRGDGWIQTFTGRRFWPLEPRVENINSLDIAHALSMKCRFTGHCRDFYSVAQHSVLVSNIVPPEYALWGLLHDAAEAYLPDVARPIKSALTGFCEIEDRLMSVILKAFGLSPDMPASVKHADLALLHTERRDLMGVGPCKWRTDVLAEPLESIIFALDQARAKSLFIDRFSELMVGAQS